MMFSLPSLALAIFSAATYASAQSDIPLSNSLQKILSQSDKGMYTYPTSLTQGIIPKPFHSHNDYWRPVPFYSALSHGAISIEADVWLYNDTLHVGHEESALTANRTLKSLYIDPLLSVLRAQNPDSEFITDGKPTRNGVFDTNSGQTTFLFIDVKTEGAETFSYVIKALQPLRDAGYLTVFNGSTVIPGPVTVIGTGNTPLNQIQGVAPRDYFFDAQLSTLRTAQKNITAEVSPIASTDFSGKIGEVKGGALSEEQLEVLRGQIEEAHAKGIMVRYWDLPGWPVRTRDVVWRTLWDEGVDLLNVDDLEAVANF
ncbi:PLC-like phosphodiesterase [Pseudomassariella vexata]|uniref:PLC-like phosphodiesterase n=1 Tax=Pseudomassariella vexata TaxID=1141098 RepID=A0A1Y2DHE3_9PEZI|nr:PLC-like phosphodiesterase [Pseudomassariella vexata]ORY58556.1 PLC-like phosphodiesterase [Pseudomassariella vexata]